ncbi:DNA polymerase IV [uncultured Roseivirga sp.]|uniref:DNA polymerase IV n=1 Tax=uncultured Roseivirga sp. TaxID=543088 RepID=UPI002584FE54|nr:DNA polymerase IV [uncultured Roseivirga sp.]
MKKASESFRKIIHVDMDAFFASVEQRDNPELKGKPVAVGGSRERGVVAAASYEARKYGVRSAMPSSTAYRKCPQIIFVKPRFERYKEVSGQIRAIFAEYTDLIEPLSLDEAFLDVTHNKKGIESATLIAKDIKKRIKETTGLTASAGISINKFIAKIASDYNKPDGITLVGPEKVELFLEKLAIEKFFGVGKVTAEKMKRLGIVDGKTLKEWTKEGLTSAFGKSGGFYYEIVRGNDNRPVNPNRIRKSLGAENTFSEDFHDLADMKMSLDPIARTVYKRLEAANKWGKTLTVKVKFSDFTQITRSQTHDHVIDSLDEILEITFQIMDQIDWDNFTEGVRLLGITLSNFEGEQDESPKAGQQLTLEF